MALSMATLLTSLTAGIAGNAATKAWCQTHYTHDHQVFVGLDMRNPPEAADAPYVVIIPSAGKTGRGVTQWEQVVELVCVVAEEGLATGSAANVSELAGIGHLEAFRALVLAAVKAVSTGNALLVELDTEYGDIDTYPLFIAGMRLRWEETITMGSDPLV